MKKNISFREKFEPFFVAVVKKDVKGFSADLLRSVLSFLSYFYGVVIRVRVFLYAHRVFRSKSMGCLVISVGNITVGGTGKTPIAEMLSRQFIESGRKVAILSRGYKSETVGYNKYSLPKIVSDGESVLLDPIRSGDEPYMLAKQLPKAIVLVDKNRVRAARRAIRKFKADTIILDDGYQYLALSRNINIAVIDSTNPFGKHKLLPRGLLREPIEHLNRADIFFLTKTKGMSLSALKGKLKELNPKADIVETTHKPKYLNDVYTGTKRDLVWLFGKKVCCVSGIASPEGFENVLSEMGVVTVSTHRFPDHHLYTKNEINEIIKCAKLQEAAAIVTTEKDAVRFPKVETDRDLPLYYLRVEIEIQSGAKEFYNRIGLHSQKSF